jgi:hypothetical protein
MLAGCLVAASVIVTAWMSWTRRAGLAEAAALGVLGWFAFTTQAHENHLFFALPLLSLAWPSRPGLLVPFGILTLTLLANMLLQDQLVLAVLGYDLYDTSIERLRLLNAGLNVALFLGWSVVVSLRAPARAMTSVTVTVRPWSERSLSKA